MENKRELGDELTDNKAVQTGGATLFVAGASHLGFSAASTAGVGALTTGKAGLILAGLGPWGLAIGGCLLLGGAAKVLIDRHKERNGRK